MAKDSKLKTVKTNRVPEVKKASKETKAVAPKDKKVSKVETKSKDAKVAPKVSAKETKAPRAKDAKTSPKAKDTKVASKVSAKETKAVKAPKANPLHQKLHSMLEAVKISADKVKFADDAITVTVGSSLSAKQFSKIKSLSGKKAELAPRGDSWIITYK